VTQHVQPAAPQVTGPEARRRLHPLTPLLRGARLVVLAIAAISWRGYQDLGAERWLLAIAGLMVLVLIGSVVTWLVTGYHVVDRELRIYQGLLWRSTRAIPLERLQAVELVQPLLARIFGLAELRLDVVGGDKSEAPLAFLTVSDARALRARLLSLAGRTQAIATSTAEGEAATPGPAERGVHSIDNGDLIVSQLLRPQWWAIPLAIAAPVFFFFQAADLGFIAIASMITGIVGAVLAPVRHVLSMWGFTVAVGHDGLRIRRGLTERRSQTVPPGRIQSTIVQWPLLWRMKGWVRVTMHVAGVRGREELEGGGALLPVGTVPVAELTMAEATPGFVLRSVVVSPVPGRAGWLAPLRRFVLGYQLAPGFFVARDGLITRQLAIVPYGRIQSVRVRQGPLQRMLRLASVFVDTAAGPGAAALHRNVAEARALAAELAERSRQARRS
jgi:putative membrane protein